MNLNKSVVLITGASEGIGRSLAKRFAKEGSIIILVSRNEVKLKEVSDLILGHAYDQMICPTDVGNYNEVNATIKKVIDKFGRIDILINHIADTKTCHDHETNRPYLRPALPNEWNGGRTWWRRGFLMILVYRPPSWLKDENGEPYGENVTLLVIQKAKPKGVAINDATARLVWDWKYNRYFWNENGGRKFAFITNAPKPMKPYQDFTESVTIRTEDLF